MLRVKLSSKTTTITGREWSSNNRSGGAKETPPKTILSHKKDIPASIGMDSSPSVQVTWLPRPPQPEVHLLGLMGHSASRLKPPQDGLPRPYQNPKVLLPRHVQGRSLIAIGGRLREFVKAWMGIAQDPFMLGTI